MLLLEYNIIKKERIDKNTIELNARKNSNLYKIELISNIVVYARDLESFLAELYNLIF